MHLYLLWKKSSDCQCFHTNASIRWFGKQNFGCFGKLASGLEFRTSGGARRAGIATGYWVLLCESCRKSTLIFFNVCACACLCGRSVRSGGLSLFGLCLHACMHTHMNRDLEYSSNWPCTRTSDAYIPVCTGNKCIHMNTVSFLIHTLSVIRQR